MGGSLILLGTRAFFSGEEAAHDEGRIVTWFAIVLGPRVVSGGVDVREEMAAEKNRQVAQLATTAGTTTTTYKQAPSSLIARTAPSLYR